jgi:hypothetical protein
VPKFVAEKKLKAREAQQSRQLIIEVGLKRALLSRYNVLNALECPPCSSHCGFCSSMEMSLSFNDLVLLVKDT